MFDAISISLQLLMGSLLVFSIDDQLIIFTSDKLTDLPPSTLSNQVLSEVPALAALLTVAMVLKVGVVLEPATIALIAKV